MHGHNTHSQLRLNPALHRCACSGSSHLIIDQQLHGVAPPFDEHQLIGLPGRRVGEGRPQARARARLDPQTQGQGEDLVEEALLQPPVHVVGSDGEADLEGI